jgi:hypothetical protein
MSKGKAEDKDNGEKYLHLGKKVDMKGVEESLPLGMRNVPTNFNVGSRLKHIFILDNSHTFVSGIDNITNQT